MKFVLSFDVDNAAFDSAVNPDERDPLAVQTVILAAGQHMLACSRMVAIHNHMEGTVRDYNGNIIGSWKFAE